MTPSISRRARPSRPLGGTLALAALAVALLLAAPACGRRGGTPSLEDVDHWRSAFSRGEGMKDVAAQGTAAVPLLRRLIADTNEAIVQTAAMVAQQIGTPASDVVPALLDALNRFPGQPAVTEALKAMKASAVPYLVPMLSVSDAETVTRGVQLLNGIGEDAQSAIEPLMKIIEGNTASLDLKKSALVTLGSIGTPAMPVLERLALLSPKEPDLQRDIGMAIKRIRTAKKVVDKGGDK